MRDMIKIKDLSFSYHNKLVFDKLNLSFGDGEWVTVVGPNGSGKSTLVKILVGLLPFEGNITIDNLDFCKENLGYIRKEIGVVFENADDSFVAETVADDIAFSLENLSFGHTKIKTMINEIADTFKIQNILELEPHTLSGGEKQKVAIAAALVSKPKILIIDDALEMIDNEAKEEILKILNKFHKEEKTTIINITHNLEEAYYADRIVVINDGALLMEGPLKEVLKEDKIFNRIGIEVPFMVDLSNKLRLYGLVDHMILNMDEMVNELWP